MKRLVPLAILGLLALALVAPAGAAASSEHYAHPFFHVLPGVTSTSPKGLSPATIKSVYNFSTSASAGVNTTIAIVDAYDDPTVKADLDVFNSTFGFLTFPTCGGSVTTTCFKKVDQNGGTSYPRTNAGWALEIALDVEWAHAIAPGAKILLVEATTNSFTNLLAAEDYAAKTANATFVSNSWGGSEFSGETSYDAHFVKGKTFASSGDGGAQSYPSTSPNLISVGGTTLNFNRNGSLSSETGWSGSGGGCSAYETKDSYQNTGTLVSCSGKRATPDVSLDADPASGVSVYDTTRYQGITGWFQVGGTSVSSPTTAGHAATVSGATATAQYVYGLASTSFRDILSGSNSVGSCGSGYDLVTGRGSWL